MMERVVAWSARHPGHVFAIAALLAAGGALGWRALGRDVIPDLSDPQIVLVAEWMGHPAPEVASAVTGPLVDALAGTPGTSDVRASSMSGMAYLDVVFSSAAGLPAGHKAILDRVARTTSKLPPDARVRVGPMASSTGWVYEYALVDPARHESPLTLRRFQDDVLRPALAAIPGVAEVASVGGGIEHIVVEARLGELRTGTLALSDVLVTLRSALARSHPPGSLEELSALPVTLPPVSGGRVARPVVRIGDVANVRIGSDPGGGFADLGGAFAAVGGIVIAERGADLPALIDRVGRTLERERAAHAGRLELVTVHDRLSLVDRVGWTLWRTLAQEIAVAGLVILVFLVDGASALVPLVTLPVVLLLAFGAMWIMNLPATLMSLSGMGMAIGLAVDADVVALEACHRRLEGLGAKSHGAIRRRALVVAANAFTPAIQTSLFITALTFLPVLAWSGETGRLLRPLALGKTLVIAAAALVTFTLGPALRDRLLRGRIRPERDHRLTRGLVRAYRPLVHFALSRPRLTVATAALAVVSCLAVVARLGGEFLPRIDEGDVLFMPTTLPGIPADEAMRQLRAMDRAIGAFPEVATVFGKVGRSDSATDPAPYAMAETIIHLRPREEWPQRAFPRWYSSWAPTLLRRVLGRFWPERRPSTPGELVERLDQAARLPGWTNAWTAPIRARLDMMSTGVRTPLAIRIVAASAERLATLGPAFRAALLRIPGTRSATLDSQGGETWPKLEVDPAALSLHHVDGALARLTADVWLAGGQIGELEHDGRRLRVYLSAEGGDPMRGLADRAREITVRSSDEGQRAGAPVALGLLGRMVYADSPAMVRTEHGQLVSYVYVDPEPQGRGGDGDDLLGYVERASRQLDLAVARGEIALGPAEHWECAGQYQLFAAGKRRLAWIIPLVLISMLGLLRLQLGSLTEALIVMLSVPFALVGSFWTLYWLGYPLSPPVWVGLISTLGLAMQTGVVMVVYIDDAFHRRVREGKLASRADIVAAHAEGTIERLRPKVMTVTIMAASLLPLLWADGAGAEIMRRVAAPMMGGLATSAFLTLEVLPVVYTIWRQRQLRRAERLGVPIETIVGSAPGWARGPSTQAGGRPHAEPQ